MNRAMHMQCRMFMHMHMHTFTQVGGVLIANPKGSRCKGYRQNPHLSTGGLAVVPTRA